jgi:hypothetical protein
MPLKYRNYRFFPNLPALPLDDPFQTFRCPLPNFRIPGTNQAITMGSLQATVANEIAILSRSAMQQITCIPSTSTPGQVYGKTKVSTFGEIKTATKYFSKIITSGAYGIAWAGLADLPLAPVNGQTVLRANTDTNEVRQYVYAEGAWHHVDYTVISPIRPTVTIDAVANGTTSPLPGIYPCVTGSSVSILSVPDPGWGIQSWTDSVAGVIADQDPYIFSIHENREVTPLFSNTINTLTVNAPAGTGVPLAALPSPPPGVYAMNTGSVRHLVADPGNGVDYVFEGWVDDTGTMLGGGAADIDVTVDHDFTATPWYDLHDGTQIFMLDTAGTGTGSTDPVSPGSYSYFYGTAVDLTATPDAGSAFDHWEIDGVFYYDNPHTLYTGSMSTTVRAIFV